MKMHKIEMYVIDFEELDTDSLMYELKNEIDGIVHVSKIETVDIGEFEDDHELNQQDATTEQHERYFLK